MPRIKKPKWVQLTKENFKVGATVRVNPEIDTPRWSWGAVEIFDEGIIMDVGDYIDFQVNFPKQCDWAARMSEMQIKIN